MEYKRSITHNHLLCLLFLLTYSSASTKAATPSDYTPKAYEVVFKLERQDINAGKMTISLEKQNGSWLGKSSYKPSFIAKMLGLEKSTESTQFVRQQDKFVITEYNMNLGKDSNTIKFDPEKNTYNSSTPLPEHAQTNQTILSTLSQDISQGKTQTSYKIFNKEEFKTYDISYQYNEKIVINKENINTVKATLSKGKRTTVFWLAEKWNWAPVQFAKYRKEKNIVKGSFKTIKM